MKSVIFDVTFATKDFLNINRQLPQTTSIIYVSVVFLARANDPGWQSNCIFLKQLIKL